MSRKIFQAVVILTAGGFIFHGVTRGEVAIIFQKAARICMECIGLG